MATHPRAGTLSLTVERWLKSCELRFFSRNCCTSAITSLIGCRSLVSTSCRGKRRQSFTQMVDFSNFSFFGFFIYWGLFANQQEHFTCSKKIFVEVFFPLFYSPHITVEIIIRDAPINWPGTRIGWFKAWPATSQPDISDSVPDGFIHISPTCQSTDMDREIQIWRKILQMPLFMNMKRAWRRKPGCVELVSYYTPLITYNKYI